MKALEKQSHIKKERSKARELRASNWWKQKIAEGLCYYCENTFSKDQLTMDHKVPVSRGGRSVKGNVVVCCKECNNLKKNKTPVDLVLESVSGH